MKPEQQSFGWGVKKKPQMPTPTIKWSPTRLRKYDFGVGWPETRFPNAQSLHFSVSWSDWELWRLIPIEVIRGQGIMIHEVFFGSTTNLKAYAKTFLRNWWKEQWPQYKDFRAWKYEFGVFSRDNWNLRIVSAADTPKGGWIVKSMGFFPSLFAETYSFNGALNAAEDIAFKMGHR